MFQPSSGIDAPTLNLEPYEHRAAVLSEVHARPFRPIEAPARLVHFAFLSSDGDVGADALSALSVDRGGPAIAPSARHHRVNVDGTDLRWERHNEFTSYCWYRRAPGCAELEMAAAELASAMAWLPQPGPHLVSIDLRVVDAAAAPDIDAMFAKESLCMMKAEQGAATVATDFKPDAGGFVRILVVCDNVPAMRIGALVQRLLELETYRLLALLCIPEGQAVEPTVRSIERDLVQVTQEMTQTDALEGNEVLLDRLVRMAARLEASAAHSLFRFGASRAYQNIVLGRIAAIGFEPIADRETIPAFLSRRMAPALQTCFSIEERQINLSRKLARATQLLRAKVDVAIERQNRDILRGLDLRSQMQLRLQRTVEGLSIAAVSYYVVGLLAYLFKALLPDHGIAEIAVALTCPLVVAGVALTIYRRTRLSEGHGPATK
ncbi:DUF3422 domain-containing protein [Devosia sp. SL43]|uniref:DUF3422 domain-containing protein n=1 Tax=Devosia sp. SL43 TaxID=2806348 RepID=UPI001F3F844A|nr:DUF3422 domain-containing protein [Devosia sp. SL43]UJW86546.1 DUF3422 domain-containing protein [Devosia sp. SL43]